MDRPSPSRLTLLALAAALVGGCSSGTETSTSDNSGGTSMSRIDFVVRDLPHPELFSFHAEIAELRLESETGELSENYVRGIVPLDLLRPQDLWIWLSRINRIREASPILMVRFVPGSYRAALPDGTAVDVVASSDEMRLLLSNAGLQLNSGYLRCDVALDLGASLTGDASLGSLQFDPRGNARLSRGIIAVPLESRLGLVRDRDLGSNQLTIDFHADENLSADIGQVRVRVPQTALLIDNLDQVHTSVPFFFTYFTPGSSVVDVLGMLGSGGELNVLRVELEDQNGVIASPKYPVKALVRVTEIVNPFVFRAQLRSIRRGAALLPVMPMGAPEILVNLTAQSQLVFHERTLMTPADLTVGMELLVKSPQLLIDPLQAGRIEIVQPMSVFREAQGLLTGAQLRAASESLLITQGGEIESAFGTDSLQGPASSLRFELTAETVFEGVALDAQGLTAGPKPLQLEVQGTDTGSPGLLRATRVTSR